MEPITTAAAAAAATSLVVRAAEKAGDKLLDKATDAAADETVGLARRLVTRILRRDPSAPADRERTRLATQDAIEGVVVDPGDPDNGEALEATLKRLLKKDAGLLADISDMLPSGPVARGERSVAVGGDNSGVIVTGDSNHVQHQSAHLRTDR